MTDINSEENIYPADPTPSPAQNPDLFEFFAFVVDGEVAVTFAAHKEYMANYVAAWSSNPKTVVLSDAQKNVVGTGWVYDETTGAFAEPA
jgi:glyoxylate utilization-related uncharacterized protein